MPTIKTLNVIETQGQLGFNRVARINFSDISAAATSATVKLSESVAVGSLIKNFSHRLVTPFDGGATTELTVKVGHNGAAIDDDDAYIVATSIHLDATEILCAVGAGTNNANGYMPREVTDIEAVFTATGANTSVLTTGEVELRWLEIPANQLNAVGNY
jgi:hypothetical protein